MFGHQIEKTGCKSYRQRLIHQVDQKGVEIPGRCLRQTQPREKGDKATVVLIQGDPVKIDDLARKMISLAGLKVGTDIEIEYVGLRPGEKLYEEVLSSAENTDPTSHDRIRIARVRGYDYDEALKVVNRLETLSREVEITEMVRLMKKTVPEFRSQNSRFCALDTPEQSV